MGLLSLRQSTVCSSNTTVRHRAGAGLFTLPRVSVEAPRIRRLLHVRHRHDRGEVVVGQRVLQRLRIPHLGLRDQHHARVQLRAVFRPRPIRAHDIRQLVREIVEGVDLEDASSGRSSLHRSRGSRGTRTPAGPTLQVRARCRSRTGVLESDSVTSSWNSSPSKFAVRREILVDLADGLRARVARTARAACSPCSTGRRCALRRRHHCRRSSDRWRATRQLSIGIQAYTRTPGAGLDLPGHAIEQVGAHRQCAIREVHRVGARRRRRDRRRPAGTRA